MRDMEKMNKATSAFDVATGTRMEHGDNWVDADRPEMLSSQRQIQMIVSVRGRVGSQCSLTHADGGPRGEAA